MKRELIHRTNKHKGGFSQIDNNVIKAKYLSDRAFRVLAFMLSKPNDWVFHLEKTAEEMGKNVEYIKRAWKELEDHRHLRKNPKAKTREKEIEIYEQQF